MIDPFSRSLSIAGMFAQSNARVVSTPAFSPASLFSDGEQGAWYDPSDLSTLWQDVAGTTAVTAAGQLVARIDDKSGNGNHATQSTFASRPALRQDGTGNYCLEFDGTDDWLKTSAVNFVGSQYLCVVIGANRVGTARGIAYELTANATNNVAGSFGLRFPESSTVLRRWERVPETGGASQYKYTTDADTTPALEVLTVNYDQAQILVENAISPRKDGIAATVTAAGASGSPGTGFANDIIYIGRRGGVSLPFNGHIYQIIIRGAETVGDDLDSVESYVANKTGVTLS